MLEIPITSVLANADVLRSALGHDPHFHDAEVISLRLDRVGRDQWDGPILFVELHLFDGVQDATAHKGIRWDNHKLVTFRFASVALLDLTGFNQQNAIFDLRITETDDEPADFIMGRPRYRVDLIQSFGISCTFICAGIEVDRITNGPPAGSVYADEPPNPSA